MSVDPTSVEDVVGNDGVVVDEVLVVVVAGGISIVMELGAGASVVGGAATVGAGAALVVDVALPEHAAIRRASADMMIPGRRVDANSFHISHKVALLARQHAVDSGIAWPGRLACVPMQFGVCYYPEQWPEERWDTDAALMADIGFELVRVGEFAWSSYEPARDQFRFDWLDRVLERLAHHGLKIVLGTPTATPPVWLARQRPDILSVGADGRRRAYGSRRHTCTTSAAYRDEAARIVGELLDRYGSHPDIVAWQVDNETGNHDSARCWCTECQAAFSSWLAARFGTIDALNAAWGTVFWSMTYPDFGSVLLPEPTMTSHNPSLRLAHAKFASDQTIEFLRLQFDQIRASVEDDVEITTNFYSEDTAVDQRAAARLSGLASMDNYPQGPQDPMTTAYHLDLTRWAGGLNGTSWIMEQQAGPINWTEQNPQVPDGQVNVWAWQAALHDYDALLFFRWRAARYAQEMYHSGLLRHDGSQTGTVAEIKSAIHEISTIPMDPPRPRVALLHSYKDVWAIEINPHREGLTHRSIQLHAYVAARRLGLEVAIVDSIDDLSGFEWVLAPALHITTPERIVALNAALEQGVNVVLGPRAMVMDRENAWSDQALPAGLADRLGARVVETLSQTADVTVDPWGTKAGVWTDVFDVAGADILATYSGGTYLDGRAAAVGNDHLFYAGFSDGESWTRLLADLTGRKPQPPNLETFERGNRLISIDHNTLSVDISGL